MKQIRDQCLSVRNIVSNINEMKLQQINNKTNRLAVSVAGV